MKEFLLNLDRRVIFLFVFLGVALPMLIPFHLPIKPTRNVRAVYDTIEAVAQRGAGTVLMSLDYGPSSLPELEPMALSLLHHCFRRGLKVVVVNLWPQGVGMAQQVLDTVSGEMNKVYGEDYVFLGYKPGFGTLVISMGQDFQNACVFCKTADILFQPVYANPEHYRCSACNRFVAEIAGQ